jgi:hypothetical protein
MEELRVRTKATTEVDTIVIDDEPADLADLIDAARAALEAADAHLRRRGGRIHRKQPARHRAE